MLERDIEAAQESIARLADEANEAGEKVERTRKTAPEDSREPIDAANVEVHIKPASDAGVGGPTSDGDAFVEVERKRMDVKVSFDFGSDERATIWLDVDTANQLADMLRKAAR